MWPIKFDLSCGSGSVWVVWPTPMAICDVVTANGLGTRLALSCSDWLVQLACWDDSESVLQTPLSCHVTQTVLDSLCLQLYWSAVWVLASRSHCWWKWQGGSELCFDWGILSHGSCCDSFTPEGIDLQHHSRIHHVVIWCETGMTTDLPNKMNTVCPPLPYPPVRYHIWAGS
jgi:hypothetical protein